MDRVHFILVTQAVTYIRTMPTILLLLFIPYKFLVGMMIGNGNRTEWSPIRSVITRVITKPDDRAAGERLVYHEYAYRPNWTTRSPIAN